MGVNPYHELNRDIPIANGRYRMLLHHLQSYTKYGSALPFHNTPNFGLFCAASQVQLDAQADTAVDMLNVFARLPLRPQATKRERELLLCHVKLLFWRSTAAITLTARRPEIKGGVLLMPCDIGRVDRIAAEDPAAFETIKAVLGRRGALAQGRHGGQSAGGGPGRGRSFPSGKPGRAAGKKAGILHFRGHGHLYSPAPQLPPAGTGGPKGRRNAVSPSEPLH